MTDEENKWPKKFSLLDRHQQTVQAYLISKYGARFYNESFLEGISKTRRETDARVAKQSGYCFFSTTILAFLNFVSGTVTIYGVEIPISQNFIPIITLICASTFLALVIAVIDDLLLQRYIYTLGSNLQIYNFKLFLLDKMAIGLWADAMQPSYFGEESGKGHEIAALLLSWIIVIVGISVAIYPMFFISNALYELYNTDNSSIAHKFLAFISTIVLLSALGLIAIFLVKFKFNRANFTEGDNEPTEEFLAEIDEKFKTGSGNE